MKKIMAIIVLLTIIISTFSTISAAELKTNLNIVQKESEKKSLEQGDSYYTNKIASIDSKKGIVNMVMTINNISIDKNTYENTEIFIIVDENIVNKSEKLNEYVSHINTLATKIFDKNPNSKIGIIGMKGTVSDITDNPDGTFTIGPNDEGDVPGSDSNAEILLEPTTNLVDISNAISNMNTTKTTYKINLQAAIKLANSSFSNNVNKILISLYDGVPSISNGVNSSISYGGWFSEYATVEEAVIGKHEKIVSYTKNELLKLKTNSVDFILLRPDDTSFDQTWFNTDTGEKTLDFDGSPYVKELYGTMDAPTYGTMYSLNTESLEKIVTEKIYANIIATTGAVLTSSKVNITFSDDILKNFEIVIDEPKVDTANLKDDKYIVWNVGDVETGNTATLKYSLKIKDMANKDILEKVLTVNNKVELIYTNYLNTNKTVSLSKHPSVKLSEEKVVTNTPEKDDTPATGTDLAMLYNVGTMLSLTALLALAIKKH